MLCTDIISQINMQKTLIMRNCRENSVYNSQYLLSHKQAYFIFTSKYFDHNYEDMIDLIYVKAMDCHCLSFFDTHLDNNQRHAFFHH